MKSEIIILIPFNKKCLQDHPQTFFNRVIYILSVIGSDLDIKWILFFIIKAAKNMENTSRKFHTLHVTELKHKC